MIKINPRKLILIDAIGAILSSIIIVFGLIYLDDILGMPKKILRLLAVIPLFYFIYSLFCYLKIEKLNNFLKIIALANLCYCLLTLTFVFYHFTKLTIFEILYFILEIIVLIILSIIELKTSKNIT